MCPTTVAAAGGGGDRPDRVGRCRGYWLSAMGLCRLPATAAATTHPVGDEGTTHSNGPIKHLHHHCRRRVVCQRIGPNRSHCVRSRSPSGRCHQSAEATHTLLGNVCACVVVFGVTSKRVHGPRCQSNNPPRMPSSRRCRRSSAHHQRFCGRNVCVAAYYSIANAFYSIFRWCR